MLYMTSVEFFVYWMHRGLHDVRLGYRSALDSRTVSLYGLLRAVACFEVQRQWIASPRGVTACTLSLLIKADKPGKAM